MGPSITSTCVVPNCFLPSGLGKPFQKEASSVRLHFPCSSQPSLSWEKLKYKRGYTEMSQERRFEVFTAGERNPGEEFDLSLCLLGTNMW